MVTRTGCAASVLLLGACNLTPVAPPTGGIDGGGSDAGASCPRAFVVTESPDGYSSTNVSVVATSGEVLSASILSSGSSPPGLTAALSGDVISPLARPPSGALVLIDRTNCAIDWLDPTTAKVEAQLSVATGFSSDPQDYLEVSASKAYVSRYLDNTNAGKQPDDAGGDLVVVDLTSHTLTGRIDLTDPDDKTLWPRPDRMLLVGGQVWVSLERIDANYKTSGDARIAGVDPKTDERTFTLDLQNLVSCGGLAISPSGRVVAAACGGEGASQTNVATNGIVLLDATKSPPVELKRFQMPTGAIVAPTIAFVSETVLVGYQYGDSMTTPPRNDVGYTLDTTTGAMTELFDSGAPFALGDVKCTPGCSDVCAMADAKANGVRFWNITNGALVAAPTVNVDPSLGLPPRGLGEL